MKNEEILAQRDEILAQRDMVQDQKEQIESLYKVAVERKNLVETQKEEIEDKSHLFLSSLEKYNPRKYILDNLTLEKQAEEIIKLFE